MSFTLLNYPAVFASEGNPLAHGGFPGDYDPYVHGVNDTMDVDDDSGFFSLDVCLLSMLAWITVNISSIWRDLPN